MTDARLIEYECGCNPTPFCREHGKPIKHSGNALPPTMTTPASLRAQAQMLREGDGCPWCRQATDTARHLELAAAEIERLAMRSPGRPVPHHGSGPDNL